METWNRLIAIEGEEGEWVWCKEREGIKEHV